MPDLPAAFAADRRLTLGRQDLPAPTPMVVAAPVASLKRTPDPYGPLDTTLLFGADFDVYDVTDGWAWGQAREDGYVGHVPAATLDARGAEPTHTVCIPMTHLYDQPDIKREPMGMLLMNARVRVEGEDGKFLRLAGGLFVQHTHVAAMDDVAPDYVTIARMFLHAPYLWGGNSVQGVDCSGLVQVAMARAGVSVLRDSDMLEATVGEAVDPDGPLRRGDLVFWKGHVGIMTDETTLLHATEYTLRVIEEPFAQTRSRLNALGLPVTSVKRSSL